MGQHIVLIGTGGTIAGRATSAEDNVSYRAGSVSVEALMAAVPALSAFELEAKQLAQVDSKDMSHAIWQNLAVEVARCLVREDISGVVITHGTDTLEETAWFLHRVLAPRKPVVLTAAMRPATSLTADGPQNLLDAVTVAAGPQAAGVLVVLGGQVLGASDVRKLHGYRVDAFSAGDAGCVARLEEGRLRVLRDWPVHSAEPDLLRAVRSVAVEAWPRVAMVVSHAGVESDVVRALVELGYQGLVAEGTGNGTLHQDLEAALRSALQQGVVVRRASRCVAGGVVGAPEGSIPSAGDLTPGKARVDILLDLLLEQVQQTSQL